MSTENTDNIVPCRDYDRMTEIWLEASSEAHDFVPYGFWQRNAEAMRARYLPMAENYAYIEGGTVMAFLSLNGCHVEALFVMPSHQRRGIGKALLDKAKARCPRLTLAVYPENTGAVGFYLRNGFTVVAERINSATGHPEKVMAWTAGE